MATAKKRVQRPAQRPEMKYGPFSNGIGVAVWLNEIETAQGTRYFRSITLAPRRYRDPKDGQWKNATSYRPVDLAVLGLALDSARQYIATHPLPGQPLEGDELEEHVRDDGEIVPNDHATPA